MHLPLWNNAFCPSYYLCQMTWQQHAEPMQDWGSCEQLPAWCMVCCISFWGFTGYMRHNEYQGHEVLPAAIWTLANLASQGLEEKSLWRKNSACFKQGCSAPKLRSHLAAVHTRAPSWVICALPRLHRKACFPLHALLFSLITQLLVTMPDKVGTTAPSTASWWSSAHQHAGGSVPAVLSLSCRSTHLPQKPLGGSHLAWVP